MLDFLPWFAGLGGVLLSIGILLYALNLIRNRSEEKQEDQDAEARGEETGEPASLPLPTRSAPPTDVPAQSTDPASPNTFAPATDPIEVARILRDRDTGVLIVEIGGEPYRKAADISDEAVGRRLVSAARELMQWLGLSAGARESFGPPPSPVASPALTVSPPFDTIPSMKPLEQIRILRARAKLPKPPPPKSVAEQIDDVLQSQIGGTPLAARRVKLLTMPGGGVRVQVGVESYEGLDAVPDEEIRRAIREAVKTWEAKRG